MPGPRWIVEGIPRLQNNRCLGNQLEHAVHNLVGRGQIAKAHAAGRKFGTKKNREAIIDDLPDFGTMVDGHHIRMIPWICYPRKTSKKTSQGLSVRPQKYIFKKKKKKKKKTLSLKQNRDSPYDVSGPHPRRSLEATRSGSLPQAVPNLRTRGSEGIE